MRLQNLEVSETYLSYDVMCKTVRGLVVLKGHVCVTNHSDLDILVAKFWQTHNKISKRSSVS